MRWGIAAAARGPISPIMQAALARSKGFVELKALILSRKSAGVLLAFCPAAVWINIFTPEPSTPTACNTAQKQLASNTVAISVSLFILRTSMRIEK
jgi:hypothetical protein